MKHFYTICLLFSAFFFSPPMHAQTVKEGTNLTQKADDGVVVAYPNPAKDFIVVKAKDSGLMVKMVTLYSILGTQVAEFSANSNAAEINIDRLRPGKYLMKYLLSDGTQKVTQIIKQ